MDSFSVASLTSQCAAISQHAVSSTTEIQGLVQSANSVDEYTQAIATLATAFQETQARASKLDQSLAQATVISERLQRVLTDALSSCNSTSAKLHKQVMRLHAENIAGINIKYVHSQHGILTAFTALLQYLAEVLLVDSREGQDASLNSFNAQELIEHASTASQHGSQSLSILSEGASTNNSVPAMNDLPIRQKNQYGAVDEPPPYEPSDSSAMSQSGHGIPPTPPTPATPPTPPIPQAGPSSQPAAQSQSSSVSFALGKAFKAFSQTFMSKPDAFVSALCEAVTNGDLQQITGLLSQGVNINGRGDKGSTPLQCAIIANQEQAANILLAAGANFTSSGSSWGQGMPPLFQAVSVGSLGIAKLLIGKGASVKQESMSGQPYFVDVVASGNLAGIAFLLDHGAKVNSTSVSGRPVLIQAVRSGNIELVQLLLKYGAKVSATDITGSSILAVASDLDNNLEMIKVLLAHGAKVDGQTVVGVTLLVDSIGRKRFDLARLLLDHGAKGKKDDVSGQPVIINVIQNKSMKDELKVELVTRLLGNGANPNAKDMIWDVPAICYAMDSNLPALVEVLLEHGAKTKYKMKGGSPLLLYAVDKGMNAEAHALLEHGADPNARNEQGKTPLMQAVVRQDVAMIKMLKDYGADLDAKGTSSIADFARAMGRSDITTALGIESNAGPSGSFGDADAPPPLYEASSDHDMTGVSGGFPAEKH